MEDFPRFEVVGLAVGFDAKLSGSITRSNGEAVQLINPNPSVRCWRLELPFKNQKVPLYIVEDHEGVWPDPHCRHCNIAADWGSTVKRRIHFLVPIEALWTAPLSQDFFEDPTANSLLYGLIHPNGQGHLKWVARSASGLLKGGQLMSLWNMWCNYMEMSQITLEDVSKKGPIDLRLFCGVLRGSSWFAKWGYHFWRGSYGIQKEKLDDALNFLANIDIESISAQCRMLDGNSPGLFSRLQDTVRVYQVSAGTVNVKGLRDLLAFLMSYNAKRRLAMDAVKAADVPSKNWKGNLMQDALTKISQELVKSMERGSLTLTRIQLTDALSSEIKPKALLNHAFSSLRKNDVYNEPLQTVVVCRQAVNSNHFEYMVEVGIPSETLYPVDPEADAVFILDTLLLRYPSVDIDERVIKVNVDTVLNCKWLLKGEEPGSIDSGNKLRCKCGACKDDGEPSMECLRCKKFEHLKCSGLDTTPTQYMCNFCWAEVKEERENAVSEARSKGEIQLRCNCGAFEDNGEAVIECCRCRKYEHLKCSGLASDVTVHMCNFCWVELIEARNVAISEEKSKAEIAAVSNDDLEGV